MKIHGTRGRLAGLAAAAVLAAGVALAGATGAFAGGPAPVAVKPAAALSAVAVTGGTWTITYDWYCDGSSSVYTLTFAADGTWTSVAGSFTHNGRWYQLGSTIVWSYSDVANLVQSATVNGNWMTGVQGYETAGGATGCFGGTLATTTAAAAAASTAKADPAAAK